MNEFHTFTVFSENYPGLLSRIANIFTRRKINIESLTVSGSEYDGIHRFEILVRVDPEKADKMVRQIQKQVDVFDAFAYKAGDTMEQETQLFRLPTNHLLESRDMKRLFNTHDVKLVAVNPDYSYFEKSGADSETHQMVEEMQAFSDVEHVRSVRSTFPKSDGRFAQEAYR